MSKESIEVTGPQSAVLEGPTPEAIEVFMLGGGFVVALYVVFKVLDAVLYRTTKGYWK